MQKMKETKKRKRPREAQCHSKLLVVGQPQSDGHRWVADETGFVR